MESTMKNFARHAAKADGPILLATWTFGKAALEAAWPTFGSGGNALDAVEAAGRFAEADQTNQTVGVGGLPDRDGGVSLDAAVMRSPAFRGGVCDVRSTGQAITLARRVAERTPHTLLAGRGAEAFAAAAGFNPEELLTPEARALWQRWRASRSTSDAAAGLPVGNFEEHPVAAIGDRNLVHDTIGILALDSAGLLAAGCTTSGLPWKLPGRVGDSALIGHGLYCDPGVGAAVCTGHGELVSGICGAFLAVETLRRGGSPLEAAQAVLQRLTSSFTLTERDQVGILVLDAAGHYSGASLRPGFKFAICDRDGSVLKDSQHVHLTGHP